MQTRNNFIEEYLINPNSMVIKPYIYDGKIYSEIYETNGDIYYSDMKPLTLIKNSCGYYGTSYEGLRSGTKHLINITHKSPIALDPQTSIFLFPTTSPENYECIWVASNFVKEHYQSRPKHTMVEFENKQMMELPVSNHTFRQQVQKTANLVLRLQRNIKRMLEYKINPERTIHMRAAEIIDPYRTDESQNY